MGLRFVLGVGMGMRSPQEPLGVPPALQAAVQAAQQPAVHRMAGMPDDEESFVGVAGVSGCGGGLELCRVRVEV